MQPRVLVAATVFLSLCPLTGLLPRAAADTYRVDGVHSSVIFRVKHLGVGYFYGRFNDLSGTVVVDDKNPANSSFELRVKADSVDTNNAKRNQHLKGPDFFNAKEFPAITFRSKQVKALGDKKFEVTGDLTLHGVTKSITVKLNRVGTGPDPFGTHRTGFETNFIIHRSDFGMNFMPQALGDDIWLLVGFEAVRR
jgi:polyisoprenoid-binding protein YceI